MDKTRTKIPDYKTTRFLTRLAERHVHHQPCSPFDINEGSCQVVSTRSQSRPSYEILKLLHDNSLLKVNKAVKQKRIELSLRINNRKQTMYKFHLVSIHTRDYSLQITVCIYVEYKNRYRAVAMSTV